MGNTGSAAGVELDEDEQREVLGFDCSARSIAERLRDGEFNNVVVMAGAGISVSCGIPDFRSPGTGLYDNLQKYNLPTPESVFEMHYFLRTEGAAFYALARDMWPDNFAPSPAHAFVRLLHDKGLLRRCFTQNIDTLERAAGVPEDKLVEAHGSFATAACTQCGALYPQDECKRRILAGDVPVRCSADPNCGGLVKPDIVFFGEGLPKKFALCSRADMPEADLLIIMGTSLTVQPFAGLAEAVGPRCPRLLLNMNPVGLRVPSLHSNGLRLRQRENYRDAMVQGPCDDAVRALCDVLGWREELEDLVTELKSASKPPAAALSVDLDTNWRLSSELARVHAAPLAPLEFHPEDFDLAMLDEMASAAAHGMALFGFREHSTLRRGGHVAVMLCVSGEAEARWEPSHVLALVDSGTETWDMDAVSNCELLAEPFTRSAEDGEQAQVQVKRAYHQCAFRVPGSSAAGSSFDVWYVDLCRGAVAARWGPVRIGGDGDENGDDAEVSAESILEDEIQGIVEAMGELPAQLRGEDEEK